MEATKRGRRKIKNGRMKGRETKRTKKWNERKDEIKEERIKAGRMLKRKYMRGRT